jgi:hypothetical protein
MPRPFLIICGALGVAGLFSIGAFILYQIYLDNHVVPLRHSLVEIEQALDHGTSLMALEPLALNLSTANAIATPYLSSKNEDYINSAIKKIYALIDIWQTKITCTGYSRCFYSENQLRAIGYINEGDGKADVQQKINSAGERADILNMAARLALIDLVVAQMGLDGK